MSVFPNKDRLGNVCIMFLSMAASKSNSHPSPPMFLNPPLQVVSRESTVGVQRRLELDLDRELFWSSFFI